MHMEIKIDKVKRRNWFQMLQLCACVSVEMVTVSLTLTEKEPTAKIVAWKL